MALFKFIYIFKVQSDMIYASLLDLKWTFMFTFRVINLCFLQPFFYCNQFNYQIKKYAILISSSLLLALIEFQHF